MYLRLTLTILIRYITCKKYVQLVNFYKEGQTSERKNSHSLKFSKTKPTKKNSTFLFLHLIDSSEIIWKPPHPKRFVKQIETRNVNIYYWARSLSGHTPVSEWMVCVSLSLSVSWEVFYNESVSLSLSLGLCMWDRLCVYLCGCLCLSLKM